MYKNVLVPYDDPEELEVVLKSAIELVDSCDSASITVLAIVERMGRYDQRFEVASKIAGINLPSAEDEEKLTRAYKDMSRKEVQENIQQFFSKLPGTIDLKIEVVEGKVPEQVINYAEEHDIECIIMGRRLCGRIRGAVDSDLSAVMCGCDKPILTVK